MRSLFGLVGGSIVFMVIFSLLMGCAPVAANYPQKKTLKSAMDFKFGFELFDNGDIKVVRQKTSLWFNAGSFEEEVQQRKDQMTAKGLSQAQVESVVTEMAKKKKPLSLMMSDSSEEFSFLMLGLVFERNVEFTFKRGVLILELEDTSGIVTQAKDQGLLIAYSSNDRVQYRDSQRGDIKIGWSLQKPDYSKQPNSVWIRLPKEFIGYSVRSVTLDPDKFSKNGG